MQCFLFSERITFAMQKRIGRADKKFTWKEEVHYFEMCNSLLHHLHDHQLIKTLVQSTVPETLRIIRTTFVCILEFSNNFQNYMISSTSKFQ